MRYGVPYRSAWPTRNHSEERLEDQVSIELHMTINLNGRYHIHVESSHKDYKEIEDEPRP